MGGEYLPDFEEGEIEVVRIDLRCVTIDAISVRLKATRARFLYRVHGRVRQRVTRMFVKDAERYTVMP